MIKGKQKQMISRHKHAFVGTDQEGDSCIYVIHLDEDGATGGHFSPELLQKIADRINNMRVLGGRGK